METPTRLRADNFFLVTTDNDDHWFRIKAKTEKEAADGPWMSCDYYTDDTDHKGEPILVRVQRVRSDEPHGWIEVGKEQIFNRVFC